MCAVALFNVPAWVGNLAVWLGILLTLMGIVAGVYGMTVWIVKRVKEAVGDVFEEKAPEIVNALVDVKLAPLLTSQMQMKASQETMEGDHQWMMHELKPNGGTSLRDAVDRIEKQVSP